ncbi:hypothetical protein F8M41_006715 [Gigaspora margarita]|uniref:Uncharacterized protein n=1 Tax=Gigaspora margarita TaxID=4874 RepID=A0A8H3X5Z8_GIGMA|nr:hypothetical protein F8M41_006715 [Gigaspora margarita]
MFDYKKPLHFYFYTKPPLNNTWCDGTFTAITSELKADTAINPWTIARRDYSVGVKFRVPSGTLFLKVSSVAITHDGVSDGTIDIVDYSVHNVDSSGYFDLDQYTAYSGHHFSFYAFDKDPPAFSDFTIKTVEFLPLNLTTDPWPVEM